ncbi:MAG: FtsX-like permease family protein [Pseudomonadota bacterium]
MFRNYLITALRNHLRQSSYTLISLAGLMLGLAVATLTFVYVWQETHYDRHLPDAERMHLVEMDISRPGRSDQLVLTSPGPLSNSIQESISGVDESTRMWVAWYTLTVDDRIEFNHPLSAVDANFPAFMGIKMLEGSIEALRDPSAALVSVSMAERLFGTRPYLGRSVSLGDELEVEIAGVYADMPETSHMDAQFLISLESRAVTNRGTTFETNWDRVAVYTYLKLSRGASSADVGQAVEALAQRNMPAPDGMTIEDSLRVSLERVIDLHLNGKTYAVRPTDNVGDSTTLGIATMVALLVLVIACINSINIATARSADRAHEVGLRKVVGASRGQLIVQFLGESALLVLLATILALVIVEVSAGPIGNFVGRTLSLSVLLQPMALLGFCCLVIGVVLLSGLYPAFVLANFKPARIFQPAARTGTLSLRFVLVVFQFVTSITLMILAGTVWQQLRFMESANLGFDSDDVVLLAGVRRDPQGTITLTRQLDQVIEGRPGILHVSGTHSSPAWDYADEALFRRATTPRDAALTVDRLAVDTDFFDVLRVEPIAGRVFDQDFGPDRAQWDLSARGEVELPVVVNVSAASTLGIGVPNDIVGEAVKLELSPRDVRDGRVVGVVPDFHFKSLKTRIRPMVFFPDPTRFNAMMVRIDNLRRDEAIASIERGWSEVLPDQALSQSFLDRDLVDQYVTEQRQFTVLAMLAGIAVFVAILGLVGLLAHAVAARRREISLRKVLGAEVTDVLKLFLWQFSQPVLAAVVIAWPIAWMFGQSWLSGFAYRVDMAWWLFFSAAIVALSITWSFTALQVFKVSRTRPATVLQAH